MALGHPYRLGLWASWLVYSQGESAVQSGISQSAPQMTQEAIHTTALDPTFFETLYALQIADLSISIVTTFKR